MPPSKARDLFWEGASKKEYMAFPAEVQDDMGYALDLVQAGERVIPGAKPLTEGRLKGLGIVELVADHDTDTYRAMYTTKIGNVVYVLHAFKKKSKSGIATPKADIDLIYNRYQAAKKHHDATTAQATPRRAKGKKH